jgi:E3 ubiquitin-protein ligase UBR1
VSAEVTSRSLQYRKSHVLYMEGNRFEEIRKNIWLGHAIPHIVARKLEQTQDHGGWEML